jgi:hypothetical protein
LQGSEISKQAKSGTQMWERRAAAAADQGISVTAEAAARAGFHRPRHQLTVAKPARVSSREPKR